MLDLGSAPCGYMVEAKVLVERERCSLCRKVNTPALTVKIVGTIYEVSICEGCLIEGFHTFEGLEQQKEG